MLVASIAPGAWLITGTLAPILVAILAGVWKLAASMGSLREAVRGLDEKVGDLGNVVDKLDDRTRVLERAGWQRGPQ